MIERKRVEAVWHKHVIGAGLDAAWQIALGDQILASRTPDRKFSGASMVKTLLAAVVVQQATTGFLDLDQPVVIAPEMEAYGDGLLRLVQLPTQRTLRDLVSLMIAVSDNTATNAIIEHLGGLDDINSHFKDRGWQSRIRQWVGGAVKASDAEAWTADEGSPAGLSVMTIADHQAALASIVGDDTPEAVLVRTALGAQQDWRSLARWLDADAEFLHKTGTVSQVRHDAGVLMTKLGPVWVACFTDGGPEPEYIDHPACVAMGHAMRETLELLGLEETLIKL
jgi:beta-lactamase class A